MRVTSREKPLAEQAARGSQRQSACEVGPAARRENSTAPVALLKLKMSQLVRHDEGDNAKKYKRNEPNR
jgi:hypothetical protein